MKTALYLRVSTNEQTTSNQRQVLETLAQKRSWQIVHVFEDAGVSGSINRTKGQGFKAMLDAAKRREFDQLVVWSVDRLGRSVQDLIATLGDLNSLGISLFSFQQGIDTTTPSGKLMWQFLSIFADFERSMIRERVKAGLDRARRNGTKLGRPKVCNSLLRQKVYLLRQKGLSYQKIARQLSISVGTAYQIINGG